jgi:arylsulfatase A-like enzyme
VFWPTDYQRSAEGYFVNPTLVIPTVFTEIPADMQGKSLKPIFADQTPADWRTSVYYHYYEFPSVHMVKRHYGIVSKEYKLVHYYYDIDEWEFLDRKADPNEMTNLYDDSNTKSIIKTMKKKLKKRRKKYKDSDELSQKYLY